MRLSRKGIVNIKRGLKRSWEPGGSHDIRFRHRQVDADTLRKRALDDRRGNLLAEIITPFGRFTLRWSVCGRTNQVDVFVDGKIISTCRPDKAFRLAAL